MWGDAVVFAAKHGNQASRAEVLIGIVFIVIVAIIVMRGKPQPDTTSTKEMACPTVLNATGK